MARLKIHRLKPVLRTRYQIFSMNRSKRNA
jgi:hypothetical protein